MISVVIPAYNEEKYIENCLRSLMNQEEKADEIIVVDNNSTDQTVAIVKKFKDVRILYEKKQGMIPARNKGFDNAKNEIIARCDADSLYPSDWLKRIKSRFVKNKDIVGVSGPGIFYDSPFPRFSVFLSKMTFFWSTKLVQGYYPLFGPNMAIKRSAWNRIRETVCTSDGAVHEDMDLARHLHPYGIIFYDPLLVVPTSLRRFIKHPYRFVEYYIRWIRTLFHLV